MNVEPWNLAASLKIYSACFTCTPFGKAGADNYQIPWGCVGESRVGGNCPPCNLEISDERYGLGDGKLRNHYKCTFDFSLPGNFAKNSSLPS
jgi:hypothetical protein